MCSVTFPSDCHCVCFQVWSCVSCHTCALRGLYGELLSRSARILVRESISASRLERLSSRVFSGSFTCGQTSNILCECGATSRLAPQWESSFCVVALQRQGQIIILEDILCCPPASAPHFLHSEFTFHLDLRQYFWKPHINSRDDSPREKRGTRSSVLS